MDEQLKQEKHDIQIKASKNKVNHMPGLTKIRKLNVEKFTMDDLNDKLVEQKQWEQKFIIHPFNYLYENMVQQK